METEPITYANLAEGEAETQLQRALAEVSQVLEEFDQYVQVKGVTAGKIVVEIDWSKDEESAFMTFAVSTTMKPPKRISIGRTAIYQNGAFMQPIVPQQAPLFDRQPVPLRAAAPEED